MKISVKTSALFLATSFLSVAFADEKDDLIAKVKSQQEEITRLNLELERKLDRLTADPVVIENLQKSIDAEVKARIGILRGRVGNLNVSEPNIGEIKLVKKTAVYETQVELKELPSDRTFTLRINADSDGKWITQDLAELDLLSKFLSNRISNALTQKTGSIAVIDLTNVLVGESENEIPAEGEIRVVPVEKANRSGPQAVALGEGESEATPNPAPAEAPKVAPKPEITPKSETPSDGSLKNLLPSFLKGKPGAETTPQKPEENPKSSPLRAANSKVPVLKTE